MDEDDLDLVMAYYGDIAAIIYGDTPCRIPDTLAKGLYEFESHDCLYECAGFEGIGGQGSRYTEQLRHYHHLSFTAR